MGQVTVLHGGDAHAMDKFVEAQVARLVPEGLRPWNVGRYDMRIPSERFRAWEEGRMEPWGDSSRVLVLDHAEALDGLKGSGAFTEEELAALTPSEKGNRLKALESTERVLQVAQRRGSEVYVYVVVHGALQTAGRSLTTATTAARVSGGQVLEFSKSSWYDRPGQVAHVQRVAEGMGVLLDDDVAEVMAYQLGESQDGYWIEQEVRKLLMWQAQTGLALDVAVVGELCSRGRVGPVEWAKAITTRGVSRRTVVEMTEAVTAQGFDLMELLGVLLKQARAAYVFKAMEGWGATEGEVASVLGWSNPRRYFPFRREHRRAGVEYLRQVCESCLQWRERVMQGAVTGTKGVQLRLLVSELFGEIDPFELR